MHQRKKIRRGLAGAVAVGVLSAAAIGVASASSHREAPLISEDPVADNTDVYAFRSPEAPDTVTLIGNWIPLEEPAGGPNFHKFGDDVLYTLNVDNDGDGKDNIVYEFRFKTTVKNGGTFLQNTGQVTSLDSANQNVIQTYTVTEVRGGTRTVLGSGLPVAPANVGIRSTPDYEKNLGQPAVKTLTGGIKVFAGPRDDPFFVDLGSAFDLLGLRPLNPAHLIPLPATAGVDNVAGYNVHSIAIQVPIARLVRPNDPVLGIYSATYRKRMRVFRTDSGKDAKDDDRSNGGNSLLHGGDWVQVSRLGMPLVNEVVIPLSMKDRFNSSDPSDDAQFGQFVLDPEPARLIPVLYPGVNVPAAPRADMVAIFLTGIPGLNQPKPPDSGGIFDLLLGAKKTVPNEMIRLNTSTPTSAKPDRLGLLAGQNDGFPNGRRLGDDVVDIELRALAGGTPFTPDFNKFPNNALTDGVDQNDRPFTAAFPYMAAPNSGYDSKMRP